MAVSAVGITTLMGILLSYTGIQSPWYGGCGTREYDFPIPWVDGAGYASGCGCLGLVQGGQCGTFARILTSYDWGVFGLDSLLLAGAGYVIVFMRRMLHHELFMGFNASYIGFIAIVSLLNIGPSTMTFADSFWRSLQKSPFQPWASTITLFVEWFIMVVLAYDESLLAGMVGNILRRNQADRTNVVQNR